jgi:hypothetical protein
MLKFVKWDDDAISHDRLHMRNGNISKGNLLLLPVIIICTLLVLHDGAKTFHLISCGHRAVSLYSKLTVFTFLQSLITR